MKSRIDARTRAAAETEALAVYQREKVQSNNSTIDVLWELYRKEKSGRRIAVVMDFEWRSMRNYFADIRPDQLTIEMCRSYISARRKAGKHDGTIWTELGHLRTVLRWAHSRRYIAFAPDVERPSKPAPKDRWLTRPEIDRLLATEAAPHVKLAILLMLATAGRVSAILELTWDRVDFDQGTINLRTSDTGPRKGRAVVPMNDGLRAALLAAEKASTCENVIEWAGAPILRLRTGFMAIVKDAGLEGVTPHVLRHTAAVHLVVAGAPMQRISQYLGHSSVSVTEKIYARFAPDHLRQEAARRWRLRLSASHQVTTN